MFGKLDKDGDGSVSLNELASALKGGKGHHHDHHAGELATDRIPIRSRRPLQGASTTSVANSDGSVTTSLTYAGRIQGNDDVGRERKLVRIRDIVLQFHRADDPASGPGDFIGRHRIAVGQRLNTRPGDDPSDCDLAEAIAPRR